MKRIIALIIATLMISLILSSCKKEQPTASVSSSSEVKPSHSDISSVNSEIPSNSPLSSILISDPDTSSDIPHFDPLPAASKWYYSHITEKQKYAYTKILSMALAQTKGYVELYDCTFDDITVADYAVRADYPEIFWIPTDYITAYDDEKYSISYSDKDMGVDWLCDEATAEKGLTEIKSAISGFHSRLYPDMEDYTIEEIAHDYICSRVKYDYGAAANPFSYPYAFTSYGALINKKAVCEGYSKAFQILMNSVGLECITVTGDKLTVGHMWNTVKIEGEWYQVDTTADCGENGPYHLFLNVTDSFMINDGYVFDGEYTGLIEGEDFNLSRPVATATEKNYFNANCTKIKWLKADSAICNAMHINKQSKRIECYIDEKISLSDFDMEHFFSNEQMEALGITEVDYSVISDSQRHIILSWK